MPENMVTLDSQQTGIALGSAHAVLAALAQSPTIHVTGAYDQKDSTKRHAVIVETVELRFVCKNETWLQISPFIECGGLEDQSLFKVTPRGHHMLQSGALHVGSPVDPRAYRCGG